MRIAKLDPGSLVLAFDRISQCTRLAQAVDTELLDEFGRNVFKAYGGVTDYDTETCMLFQNVDGRKTRRRVKAFVVLKEDEAKRRSRGERIVR